MSQNIRDRLCATLAAVLLLAACSPAPRSDPSTRATTAPQATTSGASAPSAEARLSTVRAGHTATLLVDGRVLVVGGYRGTGANDTAEIWNPKSGAFEPTGNLAERRYWHTATRLIDGSVLVIGGLGDDRAPVTLAEIWDPATGRFQPAGSLPEPRALHTATLLQGGSLVLVVGGIQAGAGTPQPDAWLWDPTTRGFAPAGILAHARAWHTATLLSDGRVLIAGGPAAAELWDSREFAFSSAGSLATARWWASAAPVPEGRVLVAGGFAGEAFSATATVDGSVDVWDPKTGSFVAAAPLLQPRALYAMTPLADGKVLLSGGLARSATNERFTTPTVELWGPATSSSVTQPSLTVARGAHTATLLKDGRILVVGGGNEGAEATASFEFLEVSH